MRVASRTALESCADRDASASVPRAVARPVVYVETQHQQLVPAPHGSLLRTRARSTAAHGRSARKPEPVARMPAVHN